MGRSRGFRKSKGICTPTSGIVRQIGGTALCINGTRDHVHLLIRMSTHHSIADIAHLIKTNLSRWVHGRWPEHHLFDRQTGYGAFTVSESGAAAVQAYTSNLQEHHKVRSFQEEFFGVFEEERICGGMNDISGLMALSPLWAYAPIAFVPTAYAVGYILFDASRLAAMGSKPAIDNV